MFPSLIPSDQPSGSGLPSLSPSLSFAPTDSPIVPPGACRKVNCSGHGKCFEENKLAVCKCEDTFIQSEKKDDCLCPEGTVLFPKANRCFAITESPTKSPVTAPTTSSPTATPTESSPTATPTESDLIEEEQLCSDSPLPMKIQMNGAKRLRKCAWVARKKTQERCSIPTVALHCPSACKSFGNYCDTDSSARMKITKDDGEVVLRYCTWVGANPDERCSYEGVASTCRATCGGL